MVKSIKLTGRITSNKSSKEDLQFVKDKLTYMTQGQFIRTAITIYRKYECGQLFGEFLNEHLSDLIELVNSNDSQQTKEETIDQELSQELETKLLTNLQNNWQI